MWYKLFVAFMLFTNNVLCQIDSISAKQIRIKAKQNIFLSELNETLSAKDYFEKANSGFYEISFSKRNDSVLIYRLDSSAILKKLGKQVYFTNLRNSDGKAFEVNKNEIIVINFWSTTCKPCIEEMDLLNEAAKNHPQIQFIGITPDSAATVQRFLQKKKFNYRIAFLDKQTIDSIYNVQIYPTHFFVNRQNLLKQIFIGKTPNMEQLLNNFIVNESE